MEDRQFITIKELQKAMDRLPDCKTHPNEKILVGIELPERHFEVSTLHAALRMPISIEFFKQTFNYAGGNPQYAWQLSPGVNIIAA